MTEFEAATVAYQQAVLAYQNAALSLQHWQLWAAIAIPLVALVVGAGQIAAVIYGINRMVRVNEDRAVREEKREDQREKREDQREKREDQREKREDQRHAEAMAALQQQGETLRALVKGMDRQAEALKVVIERTAPRP